MPVRLRRVRDDELSAYVEASKDGYAQGMIDDGGFDPEEAWVKAERDLAAVLPDEDASEGQYLFVVEDADSGQTVGRVWLGERTINERPRAFIYDLVIDEEFRGRGYGKAAMLLAEQKARELGHDEIALNVFGGSTVARSLYRSLGYQERAIAMTKRLD